MALTIGSPEAIAADAEFTKTLDPLLKGSSMGSFSSFMKTANPYIGAATGAFEIGSDFINQLKVPTYQRKDYGQYNTLDALNNVAGNTKYLDLEERNFYADSFGGLYKGAKAGMGFGPVGALVGGAVGMVAGTIGNIIGNNKRYNAEKERYESAFKDINSQANYIKSQGYYNRMWNDFGYGGKANKFWDGGELTNGGFFSNDVDIVEAGGTHEENKYGGVPISLDQQGIPNTVEEGEVIWNNYIFSNRIKASSEALEAGNLRQSYKLKTFADIAKSLQKESEERPFDFISNLGKEDGLTKLMIAQEIEKLKEQGEKEIGQMGINQFATGGDANSSQYTGTGTFVKDNSFVDHMDSNKELLRLLHQYETSGTNEWDTNYNPQGIAFGRFQHTRTFLKDLGYLKSAKGDINDLDNWTDKEIGKKYIAGDVSVQADISLKGAYRKEQSLIKNLGKKKYEDLKSQYGRENILAAAWHGGEQTVIDIVNGKDFNNRTAKSINEYTFNDTAARLKGAGVQGSSVNATSEQSVTNSSDAFETVNTPNITHTSEDPVKDPVKDTATSKVQSMQELGTYVNNTLKDSNTDWMIHAPVIGNAAAYAESLFETPETVQYDRVSPQLLTERLEYSPINEDYIADKLRNQYEGSRRGITEVTGGNRGLAQYGMMQADKNMSESLYDAYVKGREINMARKNQVMDFNRQTSQYNSQADLQAQQINTQIDMQEQNANAANRAALRNYQSEARSRFLTDLSGLGKQLRSEALAPILFGYDAYGNYIGNKKDE